MPNVGANIRYWERRVVGCGRSEEDGMSLSVSKTKTIQNILQYWTSPTKEEAVHYLCDFPAMYIDWKLYNFIIISKEVTYKFGSSMYLYTHLIKWTKWMGLNEQITIGTRNE